MTQDAKQPYVRFFVSDWLGGTRGMKSNEIGVYITLLMLMYERAAPVPENHERLARQCGCTPKTFSPILEMLVDDGKIRRVEGGLWNGRVEKEFDFRRKNSEGNSKAAKNRWQKPNKNNDDSMQAHSERNADAMPNPEARNQNIEPDGSSAPPAAPKPPKPTEPPKPTARQELETVLSRATADAVLKHRTKIRKPLTDHAAKLLAGKFAKCSNPDAAADAMIANGWQGFEPEWVEGRQSRNQNNGPTTQRGSGFLADLARETYHGDETNERLGLQETGGAVIDATRLLPGGGR